MSRNPFEIQPWGKEGTHNPPNHNPPNQPYNKARVPDQKPATIYTLFPNIDRWGIGYDSVFNTLTELSQHKPSFPPYNLVKTGDIYTITMALAGFKKEEVEVFVKDRVLTVRSDIEDRNDIPEEGKFGQVIHHGIAQRNFTTTFAIAEYIEVKSAKLEDGLLTIRLELELPEEKKPKQIEIS
jgi:molecular chaperone IbpA